MDGLGMDGLGMDELGMDEAEVAAQVEAMRQELAATPVEVVVANHCYGLFELAAVYLSQQPPMLHQARLAVDALNCLVTGLSGRLGTNEETLVDGLHQLRMAWVQIDGAVRSGADVGGGVGVDGAADDEGAAPAAGG
jgi:hypothetical protein